MIGRIISCVLRHDSILVLQGRNHAVKCGELAFNESTVVLEDTLQTVLVVN